MTFPEKILLGLRWSTPKCPNLSEHVVDRRSTSPTVTVTGMLGGKVFGQPQSVTPFHLMQRLGIRAYNQMDPTKIGDIDAHYSVHSYLWAMEYYGLMAYVRSWPEGRQFPKRDGVLTPLGYRWGGSAYRPEYAFLALLSFMGWDWPEVREFATRMLVLPRVERLPTLRRTADFYLQNPKDAYAPNGFHRLCFDGGSGTNEFRLVA